MPDSDFLSPEILAEIWGPPEVATQARNWQGHAPFARWLILQDRPKTFVELGVFRGDSYLAFCEAVRRFETSTKCFGIDTWAGDEHAGKIAEEVFSELSAFHDLRYSGFSKLLKTRFESAVAEFEDHSIDLLHVDGLHTYEAVRADYETWLPKMSPRGVMLFHDTQERERGFGVHQLWSEVSAKYPSFEFEHSHGLGVLGVGVDISPAVRWLFSQSFERSKGIKKLFACLAADGAAQVDLRAQDAPSYWFDEAARDPAELHRRALEDPVNALAAKLREENAILRSEISALRASSSWRITAPIRKVLDLLRGR